MCDYDAPAIARALQHKLSPVSILIESETHRDETQLASDGKPGSDQNRPWARMDTLFQERLRAAFNQQPSLLLDIHSFPEGSFPEGSDARSIVILDPAGGTDPASRDLAAHLVRAGIVTSVHAGSSVNAIVVGARARGMEAVLIEFGEMMGQDERTRAILVMAAWARARIEPVRLLA